MKKKQLKKGVVCVSVGLVLSMVFVSAVLFAAPTNFPIQGTLILLDTPVEGAKISAVTLNDEFKTDTTSDAEGRFTLDVPVDEELGASDPHNIVQLRIEGEEYVSVYSPFLELLNLTTPGPPVGDLKNLELSPLPLYVAEAALAAIDATEGIDDVDQSEGIVLGIIEVADGEELVGLPGVQIDLREFPSGNVINGSTILYMDANGNWDPALKSTTVYGVFIIYNIPLDEISMAREISLATSEMDGYLLGVYPHARVYAYDTQDGKHNVTVANYAAVKLVSPDGDSGGDDGGGGCFITTAALGS